MQHTEPFGRRLHYNKEEITRMCHRALLETGRMPSAPGPIEIDLFVEQYFDCRIVYEDISPCVLGFTAFGSGGEVVAIGVSASLSGAGAADTRRARTTIAHEAGHGLLHGSLLTGQIDPHPLFDGHIDRQRRRILCRAADFENQSGEYHGRWWEWQANQAIGGFLLPAKLVLECVDSLLEPVGMLRVRMLPAPTLEAAVRLVATTFDVNPVVARIRLTELFPQSEQPTL